MTASVKFVAEIWIHHHFETQEPLMFDLFSVSGYQIPLELIDDIKKNERNIDWLLEAGIPTETPVRVQVEASYDHDWDDYQSWDWWELECLGWVTSWSEEERERTAFMEANGLGEEDMALDPVDHMLMFA